MYKDYNIIENKVLNGSIELAFRAVINKRLELGHNN